MLRILSDSEKSRLTDCKQLSFLRLSPSLSRPSSVILSHLFGMFRNILLTTKMISYAPKASLMDRKELNRSRLWLTCSRAASVIFSLLFILLTIWYFQSNLRTKVEVDGLQRIQSFETLTCILHTYICNFLTSIGWD